MIAAVSVVGKELVANKEQTLESQVSKSPVQADASRISEPPFWLLETIGSTPARSGWRAGRGRAVPGAHGLLLGVAKQAVPQLKGLQQVEWFERLDGEHDDLRAVLRWAG